MTSKRHHGITILPGYLSVAFSAIQIFFLGEEGDGVSSLTLIRLDFWFSDVFREYRNVTLDYNGLNVTKNQGFILSLKNKFGKTTGKKVKLTSTSLFKVKTLFPQIRAKETKFHQIFLINAALMECF